ncbi:MAG: family lipase [Francisellaceae bacterium]|nr:family lipase [Francisellaceae bacterium]
MHFFNNSKTINSFFLFLLFSFSNMSLAKNILILGDSLSSGYGIDPNNNWVNLFARRLDTEFPKLYHVINGGISGNTTEQGSNRLPLLLNTEQPAMTIIALGSNDGLRRLSLLEMEKNLSNIIEKCLEANSKVIILEFSMPLNYGSEYNIQFKGIYEKLAARYPVKLIPFLFDKIAYNPQYTLEDGIHPNQAVQPIILELLWPYLSEALK